MENKPLQEVDFCVIDTETTGGNASNNRIIDVGVLHFKGGEIVEKFQTLINPERSIPIWITHLTGINDDMVKEAPSFAEVANPLQKILKKGIFTAHNVKFDFGFVQEEFRRVNQEFESPQCCTLKLARVLCPDFPSRSLGVLCEQFLIDIWDRHRAFGDAEATVYVLKELLRLAKKDHGIETWGDLDGFSKFGRLVLPNGIPFQQVAQLPAKPGVYLFKNEKGKIVWKGQAKDIQRRVKTFFQMSNQSPKSNRFREVVHAIEVLKVN